jgi:ABC-type amino acid transport substrate-binding protein
MKWPTIVKFTLIVLSFYGISYMIQHNRSTCPAEDGTTLRAGTNSEYPPYSFIKDGKVVGVDIDMINEIARRLGMKLELQDMAFSALLPQLQLGKIHIIAAGMTYTPERAQQVHFTKPYLTGDTLVVVTPKNGLRIHSVDDLIGKNVVVNEGFTADAYVSGLQGVNVTRLGTLLDALMTLKSGQADAFVTAQSVVKDVAEDYTVFPLENTAEKYAFPVGKQYEELKNKIDILITQMEEDGTITALKKKWNIND